MKLVKHVGRKGQVGKKTQKILPSFSSYMYFSVFE